MANTSVDQPSAVNGLSFDGFTYRWLGNFTDLKTYVEQRLKLAGKWTSLGGETKLFTVSQDEFVLKWLKSRKLIIQKDNPDEYLLKSFESDHKLCNSDCDLDRNVSQIDLQIKNIEVKLFNAIDTISKELNDLKSQCKINCTDTDHMCFLRDENEKLKKQNELLTEKLNNCLLAGSELNIRVKDLQIEKESLVTAIKVLHYDNVMRPCKQAADKAEFIQTSKSCQCNFSSPDQATASDNIANTEAPGKVQSLHRKYKNPKKNKSKQSKSTNSPPIERFSNNERSPKAANTTLETDMHELPSLNSVAPNVCKVTDAADQSKIHDISNASNKNKRVTVVAGGSLVKDLKGWRLSDSNNHVVIKSFSGATLTDMEDYLKPVLRREPNKLILHAGTNDLRACLYDPT